MFSRARHERDERLAVVGREPEVVALRSVASMVPQVVVPEHEHRAAVVAGEVVEPLELVGR